MFILHWNEELLYNRKHSMCLALRQVLRERTRSAGEQISAELRGGTSSLMKESWEKWSKETYLREDKRWEKEKKKWHNGKKEDITNRGEQHLKHRQEADMLAKHTASCTLGGGGGVYTGPIMSRPGAISGQLLGKTHEQNLKRNVKLNPAIRTFLQI